MLFKTFSSADGIGNGISLVFRKFSVSGKLILYSAMVKKIRK